MNDLIEFEIVWTEASDDLRSLEAGLLVQTRVVGHTTLRRRDLTAAMRKHPDAHGFYVRRRRKS